MKRLFSILLTLLMIMCFVGCKDPETNLDDDTKPATKPESTPSVPDSNGEELTLEIPELPKSEGTDPFLGLTRLVINQPNNYDYIKVDSENKTMIYVDYGDDGDYLIKYNYSYKIIDEKINVYLVLAGQSGEDDIIYSVQDIFNKVKTGKEADCKERLERDLDFYDEEFGSDEFEEEWISRVNYWNEEYGTNFTTEEYSRANYERILNTSLNTDLVKNEIRNRQLEVKRKAEIVRHFVFELSDIGFEESKAKVILEGVFDDSKKWYEQPNGSFYGGIDFSINGEFSIVRYKLRTQTKDYFVDYVDDTKIYVYFEDSPYTLNYTITGTGKDAVIEIDGVSFNFIWKPADNLYINVVA